MDILDTNVLAELIRARPDAAVVNWVAAQPLRQLYITAITVAEMQYGVNSLPAGKRRDKLQHAINTMFAEEFSWRILAFDEAAANYYACWVRQRQQAGQPVSQSDAQIAAIALQHEARIVTRNGKDFVGLANDVINPWGDSNSPNAGLR